MESHYSKIVAQNILKLRKEAGLSQFSLAMKAGIDPKTLYTIEHANSNLELSTLEKLSKALGVSVLLLFDGLENPSSKFGALIDLLSQQNCE